MTAWPYFDPHAVEAAVPPDDPLAPRDRDVYVFDTDERIVLAVNVAMSIRRPLLIYGPPGCGKSSLAPNVARILRRRYYEEVISSRTEAQDLLWIFDAVRRLRDAQANRELGGDSAYTEPGAIWWAFDRRSALEQGGTEQAQDPAVDLKAPAVVLLDEIDKADPDLPNNLLLPLAVAAWWLPVRACRFVDRGTRGRRAAGRHHDQRRTGPLPALPAALRRAHAPAPDSARTDQDRHCPPWQRTRPRRPVQHRRGARRRLAARGRTPAHAGTEHGRVPGHTPRLHPPPTDAG